MRIGPSFIKLGKAILYPLEVSLAAPRVACVPHRHGSGTALPWHIPTAVRLVRNGCEIARRQLSGKKVEQAADLRRL
jgi:hypothetical protein